MTNIIESEVVENRNKYWRAVERIYSYNGQMPDMNEIILQSKDEKKYLLAWNALDGCIRLCECSKKGVLEKGCSMIDIGTVELEKRMEYYRTSYPSNTYANILGEIDDMVIERACEYLGIQNPISYSNSNHDSTKEKLAA